jgi:hypothetical protein
MASSTTGSNMAYAAVSVTTTATLIRAAKSGRESLTVQNLAAATDVYVGPDSSVTTSNGLKIAQAGGSANYNEYTGALYGIVASGTADVRYAEVY